MIKDKLNDLLQNEAIIHKNIVKNGKLVKTVESSKPGWKVVTDADGNETEVQISLEEKLAREKSARVTAIKNKQKRVQSDAKQADSTEKRDNMKIGDHRRSPVTSSKKPVVEADVSVETNYRQV
jgi:hypothetical protein